MDERSLIEGMARGDQRAFREFVEQYKKKVFFLALDMVGNAIDAEDISQEVFLKVFRSFATFRKDAKLGSWLYRVTYNASIDHLRRKEWAPEPVGDDVLESRSRDNAGLPHGGPVDPAAAEDDIKMTALYALQNIGDVDALFSLSDRKDVDTLPLLKEIVLAEIDKEMARAAVSSLGEIGTPKAKAALLEILEKKLERGKRSPGSG